MAEPIAEELLRLNERLLDAIAAADWNVYAELCDPSLSCFEPEATGQLVEGLDFHHFYFKLGAVRGEHNTTMCAARAGAGRRGDPELRAAESARASGRNSVHARIRGDARLAPPGRRRVAARPFSPVGGAVGPACRAGPWHVQVPPGRRDLHYRGFLNWESRTVRVNGPKPPPSVVATTT